VNAKACFLVIALVGCFVESAYAGTNPIVGMPDYNGTYYGTPGTGSNCDSNFLNCDSTAGRQMFTALYRDNYNRASGCAGERCGKHPGVDIDVESGTPVVAAMSGTAYRVESCNLSWGGLVVIEVNSPYKAGEKAYVSYAHLRAVSVSQGATITEGQTLGESGGATSDPCHGVSTGSHLHFQVDRQHGGPYPWFPTGKVDTADTDFEVTTKTHNPLPFVRGYAYNFTFAENGNKELWGAVNVNSFGTANSDLWVDSSSAYPYVGRSSFFTEATCSYSDGKPCSREITLDASVFKRLVLRLNFKCVANPVVIYYRGPDDVWHAGAFNYDSARTYVLGMSGLSYWNGIITDLIVKPSQGCTASPGPEEYFISQMYFLP